MQEKPTNGSDRCVAIINPAAGGGSAGSRWRAVERALHQRGISAQALFTDAPSSATTLTREALERGATLIVAVGGDGTVHEVVNGFLKPDTGAHSNAVLAVVPAGTGMDFARNLVLPHRPEAIADAVALGRTRAVDIGMVDGEPPLLFVNFAEIGIGASVVDREARLSPRWPGRLSFLLAAVAAALREKPIPARVTVDGVIVYDGPLISAVVANARYFGGGMKIAPNASMEDGLLDTVVIGDFSRAELLTQIWKIYPGIHIHHPKVRVVRGSSVDIDPAIPALLDLDGELKGKARARISLLKSAIRVIV